MHLNPLLPISVETQKRQNLPAEAGQTRVAAMAREGPVDGDVRLD
jgi:hypothetical protein